MGRGGTRKIDQIGVEAVWLGEQFARGFNDYNKKIDAANKATADFARETKRAGDLSAKSFALLRRVATSSLKETTKETQNYIQTAKDLQATFQEVGRTAQQFGAALQDAAAGRAIQASFQSLAKTSGVNADKLLANMSRAARGTVEELDLVRIANRALLAGGKQFADELPRLFEIARAASVATGQDIGFVFDTLTRGIAKASPLLIDNAEIYIKVGQAVEAFAEKAGKTTDELTQQERQLATLNAVLDEGAEFIRKVGSDVEVATDSYAQWSVRIAEAKRDTVEFLEDALGPLAPAFGAAAESLNTLLPLLQTLILLQNQSAISGASMVGGLKALTAAAVPLVAVLGGVAVGVKVYEEVIRKVQPNSLPAGEAVSKFSTLLQLQARRFIEGKSAADEWFRAVTGIPTLVELTSDAQERNIKIIEETTKEYGRGTHGYLAYLDAVNETNASLEQNEIATTAMTQAQFNFQQAITSSTISTRGLIAAIQELNDEQANSTGLSQVFANVRSAGAAITLLTKDAFEAEAEAIKETNRVREKGIEIQKQANEARAQIPMAQANILVAQRQLNQQLEQTERDHQDRMIEITRKAVQDRAKAQRDFDRAVADAARTRQRALEDAARLHARNVQQIERRHRDRLNQIEENFSETVSEAAIDRDAIAIFQARRTREKELKDANQEREQALEDEGINFEDSKRQAEQAFRDQLDAAKRTLAERQRDIDRSLAEQQRKENEAQRKRLASQRLAQALELRDLRAHLNRVEAEWRAHLSRLQALINRSQVPVGRPGATPGRPDRRQEGGSGVVTGPHTFQVEPGVTEGFWFSGALGQRAPVLPTQEMSQSVNMQAAVRGAVGVGLRGFSGGLLDRIGPQLTEMVGQAVIDELADAFNQARI